MSCGLLEASRRFAEEGRHLGTSEMTSRAEDASTPRATGPVAFYTGRPESNASVVFMLGR